MKHHILIVDDDQAILDAVQTLLELSGYRVSVIRDVSSIWEQLPSLRPDLILLDLLLSGADGRDIARKIKQLPTIGSVPVILMSADTHIQEKSDEATADGYLKKPFEIEDLEQLVLSHLRS